MTKDARLGSGAVSSGARDPVGIDHFGLTVAAASIQDVIADLGRAGIAIARGPVKRRDDTALFVRDPDGVRVQLPLKTPTLSAAGNPEDSAPTPTS